MINHTIFCMSILFMPLFVVNKEVSTMKSKVKAFTSNCDKINALIIPYSYVCRSSHLCYQNLDVVQSRI
jgi:hypothetical protein